jgi:formate dehydrogenase maturation protein FdhE
MLQALHDSMIENLKNFKASPEMIAKYEHRWNDTLTGNTRTFLCPACFMAGVQEAALRPKPMKKGIHYVQCKVCNEQFSYVDDDF